jgi:hypothetical protein
MYTVIRRFKADPTNTKEILRHAEDSFLPIASKLPGFMNYSLLDGGNGDLITIAVFCDRQGSQQYVKSADDFVRKTLTRLLPNPPTTIEGEVRVHHEQMERVPC